MTLALIENNIVTSVIVSDNFLPFPIEQIKLNENEEVYEGQIYNPNETPRFSGTPFLKIYSWTAYQFLLRFTAEERAAFRAASLTDPNVADFQQLAQAAQEVISNDPMTVAGMNYLVSVNLLTEQRKNEILGLT